MNKIALNIKKSNGSLLYYGDFVRTENNFKYQLVRKDGVITYNQFTQAQVEYIVNNLSKRCTKSKRSLSWYCNKCLVIDKLGRPVEKKDYISPKFNPYRDLWQVVDVNRTSGKVKAYCMDYGSVGNMKAEYFNSEQFEIVNVARIENNAVDIAIKNKADKDTIRVLGIVSGKCLRIIYKNMEGRMNTSSKFMWLEPSFHLIKGSPLLVDRIYINEIITKVGAK